MRAVNIALFERALHPAQDRAGSAAKQMPRLARNEIAQRTHEVNAGRHARYVSERRESTEGVTTEQIALMPRDLVAHDQGTETGNCPDDEYDDTERFGRSASTHIQTWSVLPRERSFCDQAVRRSALKR
jgi:hypothetical protein